MQSQDTTPTTATTVIYDVCPECGQFAALYRRLEDGLTDELDAFWSCETCQTPVVYDTDDGAPF